MSVYNPIPDGLPQYECWIRDTASKKVFKVMLQDVSLDFRTQSAAEISLSGLIMQSTDVIITDDLMKVLLKNQEIENNAK
jgi:hypothetical protein